MCWHNICQGWKGRAAVSDNVGPCNNSLEWKGISIILEKHRELARVEIVQDMCLWGQERDALECTHLLSTNTVNTFL